MSTLVGEPRIPDLDMLLEHICLRGIPVGATELQRLQSVFTRAPSLSRVELLGLLQTVLAKDEGQRRTLERLFETLVPFEGNDAGEPPAWQAPTHTSPTSPVGASPAGDLSDETPTQKSRKPLNIGYLGLGILLLILLPLLTLTLHQSNESKNENSTTQTLPTSPPVEPKPKGHDDKQKTGHELQLLDTIDLWIPTITITPVDPLPRILPPLTLLIGAGLGFVWLLHQAIQRTRVRQPEPPRILYSGRLFLPNPKNLPAFHLLNIEARREMGLGISQYLSGQLLRQLDLPSSVAATARSGLPSIHFRAASREREVWLWQDQSSNNPDLSRLAAEITATLKAVKIFVQLGYFHGFPSQVISTQGETRWSIRHEYPENQPLVVVLSDGNSLAQMDTAQADEKHTTFRQLSHWANLCMVDCSPQPGELCRQLKPYALKCLLPQDVSGWLARQGSSRETSSSVCPLDELHRWAIACALPDRPLMEAEIRALHEALRLDCAWQYHNLKRYARESGMGFDFAGQRHGLLQDFAQMARAGNEDVQRTVAFWLRRYADIDAELGERETVQRPWKESKRQRLLALEVALTKLWDRENNIPTTSPVGASQAGDPFDSAATILYDLHSHSELRKEVERKLGAYACLDWPALPSADDKWVRLPFHWGDLPAKTRKQLLAAGFGGKAENLPLDWDKTTGVLLGVLAGLALGGLVGSVRAVIPLAPRVEVQLNSAEPAKKIQYLADGKLLLGTAKAGVIEQTVREDEIARVKWERQANQPARLPVGLGSELWRSGEQAKPSRPSVQAWPQASIAVIAADPKDLKAQTLAAKLLDNGTADQVLLGNGWYGHHAKLVAQWAGLPDTQWLYIGMPAKDFTHGAHIAYFDMSPSELLGKLKQAGIHKAADLQGTGVEGNPRLIGLMPDKDSIDLSQGIKLLPIARGSFQMGSDKGAGDEKPVHTVNINHDFWMGATEVTFNQYDAYTEAAGKEKADDSSWGRDTRPVINVSWDDAQGYVQWLTKNNGQGLSCRLPTEAEWEYTARAGTTTAYFWGNDIGKNNANCDGCGSQWDNKQTAPVGSFLANKLSLQDMHGNVWEWVQDCKHENYQGAPVDGTAWESGGDCGRRVLRGGSWYFNPAYLRSSNRLDYSPVLRNLDLGFRVVCVLPSTER
ncbi:MAG: formylglycine-generating enzyme family protein [Thiothrix sp.]|uniref:formylglycine-generating enzyme family protein n=1 Tax=Thiothrix sp. TaxID=1032 RepID=UPI00261BF928|nr:formylglycine-generating enzyme family protein [Thiothrix sp.]MDD5391986.1 formylglycine-generating enzyme family protein [Thiothrix sp.]